MGPVFKHLCYECPGAWAVRKPKIYRRHDYQLTSVRPSIGEPDLRRCRTCGKEKDFGLNLLSPMEVPFLSYMGFAMDEVREAVEHHKWIEEYGPQR